MINDGENHLSHGEAIAIGMICESWLSHKKIGLSAGELEEIVKVITGLYPKYTIDPTSYDELYDLMLKDKKNQNGRINCTLLKQIGQFSIDNICTQAELVESLNITPHYNYATFG